MVSRGGEGLFERRATIIPFPGCSVLFGATAGFNRLGEIELQFVSAGNYCLFSISIATEARLRLAKYRRSRENDAFSLKKKKKAERYA